MKTAAEIQTFIFEQTGLKTGVRKGTGSQKGYLIIYPIFQGGKYPRRTFLLGTNGAAINAPL